MFQTACPTCGAPVTFRSATSVMAVCEYCQGVVLHQDASVEMAGKMSAILEDYSPLQIGSSGIFSGRAFQTIGRIQLRYEHGFWNEWYVWFDDGQTGWLSDASNQFVITQSVPTPANAPSFDALIPGSVFSCQQQLFIASDIRTAQCLSGEGELPFRIDQGWTARVADFRTGNNFLTLDYSNAATPECFIGKSVTLTDLKMQLLRSDEQIKSTAGKLKGKMSTLACPGCGGLIPLATGVTTQLICPGCQAEIDASTPQVKLLKRQGTAPLPSASLALGDTAKILGVTYLLIGQMRCKEVGEDPESSWWEYLLYHPVKGFLWLIETEDHWEETRVLDNWPTAPGGQSINYRGLAYQHLYDYQSQVIYAAGAFNWRVSVGDRTHIKDYGKGQLKLTVEKTANELAWSQSKTISSTTVNEWFGKSLPKKDALTASDSHKDLIEIAKLFSIFFGLGNLMLMEDYDVGFGPIIFGLILLWLPILVLKLKARTT